MSLPLGYGEMVSILDQSTPADYALLGLEVGALASDVKKAYRKLARENHPDVTGGDELREARFKRVTSAYDRIVRSPLAPVVQPVHVANPIAYRAVPPIALSTLEHGDQVWVGQDAIHVGLDRHCFIDPMARLRPYETSDSAIRIDLTSQGYRITFTSTLRVNWAAEDVPIGLSVATVHIIPPTTSNRVRAANYDRMPSQRLSTTLERAPDGDVYAPIDAITVNEYSVTIDLESAFVQSPSHRAPVRISRRGATRYVRADGPMSGWLQRRNKLSGNTVEADSAQIGSTRLGDRVDPSA